MPYIIIFGWRGVTYSAGSGDFHCPHCGPQQYAHKRVRRFFTLYFIPLIPLDVLGEYVECKMCRLTYDPAVLAYDPRAEEAQFEAEFQVAVRKTMVRMCLADGVVDPDEVATIRDVYSRLAGTEITEERVREEIAEAVDDERSVHDYVRHLVGSLNDHGKEMVIKAAFLVAAADGEFQDEEQELLAQLGQALQMSAGHVDAVLAEVVGPAAGAPGEGMPTAPG